MGNKIHSKITNQITNLDKNYSAIFQEKQYCTIHPSNPILYYCDNPNHKQFQFYCQTCFNTHPCKFRIKQEINEMFKSKIADLWRINDIIGQFLDVCSEQNFKNIIQKVETACFQITNKQIQEHTLSFYGNIKSRINLLQNLDSKVISKCQIMKAFRNQLADIDFLQNQYQKIFQTIVAKCIKHIICIFEIMLKINNSQTIIQLVKNVKLQAAQIQKNRNPEQSQVWNKYLQQSPIKKKISQVNSKKQVINQTKNDWREDDTISKLKAQIRQLEKDDVHYKIQKLQAKLKQKEQLVKVLENQIEIYKNSQKLLISKSDSIQKNKIQPLKLSMPSKNYEFSETIKQLQKQINDFKKKEKTYKQQLEKMNTMINQFKNMESTLRKEADAKNKLITEKQGIIGKLNNEKTNKERDIQGFLMKIDELTIKIRKLQHDSKKYQYKYQAKLTEITNLQKTFKLIGYQ